MYSFFHFFFSSDAKQIEGVDRFDALKLWLELFFAVSLF